MKPAIVTDSNSGITQAQSKQLGVWVLPMPFYINDELFLEDITLTQEQFYDYLAQGADVKTSQPAPGDVLELECTLTKRRGPVGIGACTATVNGETACTAELIFAIQ